MKTMLFASAAEILSSESYMTIKTVLLTAPTPNLNNVRCTKEFIYEIVANQKKYLGLPLVADTDYLTRGKYNQLGHKYDSDTGTFGTNQIGSFYLFETETMNNGDLGLVGYARVSKRNKEICSAISDLYNNNMLKFSFEITCGECEKKDDGTVLIDVADCNFLESMCVVSNPACPEAVAQQLVAEEMPGKEADEMVNPVDVEKILEQEQPVAEKEEVVTEQPVEETPVAEEAPVVEEAVATEAPVAEVETPAEETPVVEAEKKDQEDDTEDAPEKEDEEDRTEDEDDPKKEDASCGKKKNAELEALIETINVLQKEIAELKGVQEKYIASIEKKETDVNPFMAEIKTVNKYSLLEKDEGVTSYTLLEKA